MQYRNFTAPGRVEIGGNHTDHQHGRVIAAAINLEIKCTAARNDTNIVSIKNKQHGSFHVDLRHLNVNRHEHDTSAALVRGIAAWFSMHGHDFGGFDAVISSDIPVGSGLSSSAAFEVLIGNVFKGLYGAEVSPLDIATAGKYAENNYFGKPCGLMDQAASSLGGLNLLDFQDPDDAIIRSLPASFEGYKICVVTTGGSHADLTKEYAYIPKEMKAVARHFGCEFLRDVEPDEFFSEIGSLKRVSDRAILRAIHFFEENERVLKMAKALAVGDTIRFLELVIESGQSSLSYLQNIYLTSRPHEQRLTLALALSERILSLSGAWRVHGGGFAGTIIAFVPNELVSTFDSQMEKVFGNDCCHFLTVNQHGGAER